jgi:S-DNA-T family DNA segregation ATPase FtsK/SpoIIIE
MIDPKRVELGMYEDIPHLMTPVVVDPKQAVNALRWAVKEMEERYKKLAAVGVHLLLATQRPSVDVITGLIKANLPSRISFRVQSKTDSRTILDGNGAEQLLGRGDMLFMPPGSSRAIRLHGPYISEQESARLASFLRKQGKPVYNTAITAEEKKLDAIDMEKDDLYDEASRIVVTSGQASISYLQRRLRIGFSRAARLVDMMEIDGLVSPGVGGKPREVLVDKGYFDEVDAQLR